MPSVALKDKLIQRVSHTKFFGVHIDKNVNWCCHISDVCTNISKICGILYRVRHQLTAESIIHYATLTLFIASQYGDLHHHLY